MKGVVARVVAAKGAETVEEAKEVVKKVEETAGAVMVGAVLAALREVVLKEEEVR